MTQQFILQTAQNRGTSASENKSSGNRTRSRRPLFASSQSSASKVQSQPTTLKRSVLVSRPSGNLKISQTTPNLLINRGSASSSGTQGTTNAESSDVDLLLTAFGTGVNSGPAPLDSDVADVDSGNFSINTGVDTANFGVGSGESDSDVADVDSGNFSINTGVDTVNFGVGSGESDSAATYDPTVFETNTGRGQVETNVSEIGINRPDPDNRDIVNQQTQTQDAATPASTPTNYTPWIIGGLACVAAIGAAVYIM